MKLSNIIILLIITILFSFYDDIEFPVPKSWPQPQYNFTNNPLSKNKIELGRALFYDPILSRDSTISCAHCHSPYSAFTHTDHALSHGINDRIGNRNAPVLINLAWQKTFMWDGAINHLDMQALAPIHSTTEMDEDIVNVVNKLKSSPLYKRKFQEAFQANDITGEYVLKSISQFMLVLISSNSKYDKVKQGKATFTPQEEKGYQLFKAHCVSCHSEPLFTNGAFKNNGLSIDSTLNDFGRFAVTKKQEDLLKFKVPTLRNIEFSYPYMHDGRFKKLKDVIDHYNSYDTSSSYLSKELKKTILLSHYDKIDIISFLLTLSDKAFLFNPNNTYPHQFFKNKPKD